MMALNFWMTAFCNFWLNSPSISLAFSSHTLSCNYSVVLFHTSITFSAAITNKTLYVSLQWAIDSVYMDNTRSLPSDDVIIFHSIPDVWMLCLCVHVLGFPSLRSQRACSNSNRYTKEKYTTTLAHKTRV